MTDPLLHVKELFVAVALDGFGTRKYVDLAYVHPGQKFLHQVVAPKLWQAILADDPAFNPEGERTVAQGSSAVKLFVAFMEGFREWELIANPAGEIWHVLFDVDGGCFMSDLCAALHADDPTWSPTPWSRNGPAVHPNLMPDA